MMSLLRPTATRVGQALAAAALLLSSASAVAQTAPCGKFDFSDGDFDCKIQVKASCSAQCTALSFEAGCTGSCTAKPDPNCVDPCGTSCIAECNPEKLDCFKGCHDECDAVVQAECEAKHPDQDCVEQAQAQCNVHCKDSCKVPPSNCQEHCESCCVGGCNTLQNFDCDFDCFASLEGSCTLQCDEPSGAIFCNGQYVGAEDVSECINWLAAQGITVDASATATCGVDGCDLGGEGLGCTASTGRGSDGEAEGTLAIMLFGLVFAVRRRRKRNE
ncbi:MAG TPA: hypothetical protein ENK23_09255 [Sorangium sp.]|nr:hypothetical protein [Sorangium sp.]